MSARMDKALRREWIAVRADEVRKGDWLANHGTITVSRPARESDLHRRALPSSNGEVHPLAECWHWRAGRGYSGVCFRGSPIIVGRVRE